MIAVFFIGYTIVASGKQLLFYNLTPCLFALRLKLFVVTSIKQNRSVKPNFSEYCNPVYSTVKPCRCYHLIRVTVPFEKNSFPK